MTVSVGEKIHPAMMMVGVQTFGGMFVDKSDSGLCADKGLIGK
jgi:hypothetical protein